MKTSKYYFFIVCIHFIFAISLSAENPPLSDQSEECLSCHTEMHPGIISQWRNSRHAQNTPAMGLKKDVLERRVSAKEIPDSLKNQVVGCYECHSINPDQHKDTFEHNGYRIHTIVSPNDCATCHPKEAQEYGNNIMADAYGNLMKNPVYLQLLHSINGPAKETSHKLSFGQPSQDTNSESCLYCHGTIVTVKGMETRDTQFGEMDFPVLKNWPNQGVGRINPDGSKGSCTSCHSRHDFSIAMARKPATCSECHKGPDVPAYKVYQVSKHGNIYAAHKEEWDFDAVPWKVGEDFTAPTCATCHVSLLTDGEGTVIAERTHQFNDRLAWRIFGAPYAHPHPKSSDLSIIINKAGLPLATELDGTPVKKFLISEETQEENNRRMQAVCLSCHSSGWVDNYFARLDNNIKETNRSVRKATEIMAEIWDSGSADKSNMFDEYIERQWTSAWLFYANSTRFTSAMAGGGDYAVFARGRYQLKEKLMQLHSWLKEHQPEK